MSKKLLLIPFMSLIFAGCGGTQTAKPENVPVAQKEAEKEVRANCKYDKDVCDYMVAQTKLYAEPYVINTTSNATPNNVTVTKMDGKGNMQSTTTTGSKVEAEMVIFNNVTYTKDNTDGKWFKMPTDDNSAFNIKGQVEQLKENLQDTNNTLTFTKVGQEACGSLTCVIYEMVDTENAELGKTKIWIDTKEHAARKMVIGDDKFSTTITYAYEPVTITEPSPVKEFEMPNIPALQNGQMPSAEDIKTLMQQFPSTQNDSGAEE